MLSLLAMIACTSSPEACFLVCETQAEEDCRDGVPSDQLPPAEDQACLCEEWRCRRECDPGQLEPDVCKAQP